MKPKILKSFTKTIALASLIVFPALTMAAVEVGNKLCPVSGQAVGEMGPIVKHEYNGKIYNLCCKMCAKDFDKDPEKFSKMAEEEAAGIGSESGHAGDDHDGHDH